MRETRLQKVIWQIAVFLLTVACVSLPTSAQTCSTFVTAKPTNVIFGPQTVGTTSAAQTVTFAGSTTCPSFTLNTFTIGGTNAGDFNATGGVTNPCSPLPITSTAITCTVGVTFTPAATGTRSATLSFASTGGTATVNLVGGDEVVFVSTQAGGQILKVDGTTGAFTVVSGNPDDVGFSPEGMVVGPDGKLYITDPSNGQRIWRMNQDGTQPEVIYNQSSCEINCALSPQGPSFSSSSTGDLYFNTEVTDLGGIFAILGVGTTPFGGPFSSPVNIVPGTCPTCFTPGTGAGTAFDTSDNLLFVEQANGSNPNSVLSVSPPYTADNNLTTLASGLTNPTAVALNKATGQLFVSDTGTQRILAIGSGGTTTTYFTFTTSTTCVAAESGLLPDLPVFMQFDATGHLFVVTTTNPFVNGCGKVWRIDPGAPPTATLLLDLQAADVLGSGLNSSQAIGLALGPTAYPAISILLQPAGGTNDYAFGCPTPTSPPASCAFDCKLVYGPPAPPNLNINLVLQAISMTQPQLDAFTTGTPFAGATLAPYAGTGGYGIRFVATCQDATTLLTIPCPQFPNPYKIVTNYNGVLPSNVAFLTDEDNGPYLLNILSSASAVRTGDPTISGHKQPVLSGFQVVGGVTGTPPTITLTSPTNTTYNLNQTVLASYACTGTYVTQCVGNVASGGAIDTTSVGTKTFTVTALVSQGPTAASTITYTVIAGPMTSISPSSVYFGAIPVGGFAIKVITVTNTGTAPLNITGVNIAPVPGGDSDDFFALSLCPKTLLPTKSCIIFVAFFADNDDFSLQSATLTITDNATGSPHLATLTALVKKKK